MIVGPYFDERMLNRQRLLWAIATRRQLERWEPYVAAAVSADLGGPEFKDADIWLAAAEHHFVLIAARNLIRALDLPPPPNLTVDPTLRTELIEGRDLHEHWVENMPIFNVTPRPSEPPYRSGRDFARRNPREGPYWWLGWSNATGAEVLPNVGAPSLHELLDDVEMEVIAKAPELSRFLVPRAPSPWTRTNDQWWPLDAHTS